MKQGKSVCRGHLYSEEQGGELRARWKNPVGFRERLRNRPQSLPNPFIGCQMYSSRGTMAALARRQKVALSIKLRNTSSERYTRIPRRARDLSNTQAPEKMSAAPVDVDPAESRTRIAVLNLMVDALLDFHAIAFFPSLFSSLVFLLSLFLLVPDFVTNDPFCIDSGGKPRSFPLWEPSSPADGFE